jgi:hypothetical protein
MELTNKTLYLLHDGDSYEIVVDCALGRVLEIWRYRDNRTYKPEFCRMEWLDEIIQDRIYDRLARLVDGNGETSS